MAETKSFALNHKELIEAIIKHQELHEGIWQLYVEFGLAGANVQTGENQVSPAAIVGIKGIGLNKVEAESPIAVDASKVNPR
jgi:hypothetical protein